MSVRPSIFALLVRVEKEAVIEAKMAQQLSYLELKPLYGVFLDLKKAFDSMDWDRCIMILEGWGAGPQMIRLIQTCWGAMPSWCAMHQATMARLSRRVVA